MVVFDFSNFIEHDALTAALGEQIKLRLGQEALAGCLESWALQASVFAAGELKSCLVTAYK